MLWQLVLVSAALAAWYYRWQRRAIYRLHREIPAGIPSYPIVGHAYLFTGTDEDRMKAFQKLGQAACRQGGLSTAWMLNRLYVVVADAETAAAVTRHCVDKDEATMRFTRPLIGNGSIFAPVEIWRPRRKLLAPALSARRVSAFVPLFDRHAAAAADQLAARALHGDFSLWEPLSAYTFDAVCETSLGVSLRSQGGAPHPFLRAFAGAQRVISRRMCAPWLYPDAVFKATPAHRVFVRYRRQIHRFIDEIIRDKRKALASSEKKAESDGDGVPSSLDLMLAGGGFSDRELREEVMVLVMAGSDTTAVGAGFALVLLSQHQQVQDKLLQELREVLGDGSRPLTAGDLARLKYLDAVVKETLRLYPPVPVTVREVREDLLLPCGRVLPAGVSVLLATWATHRSPALWGPAPGPAAFRPERFLRPLPHPAQFMPFGYSARNCLGSQYAMLAMKTVLARALLRGRFLPARAPAGTPGGTPGDTLEDTPGDTHVPLRVKFDVVMKHVDDYRVSMKLHDTQPLMNSE